MQHNQSIDKLRTELLNAQMELHMAAKSPLVILISGQDGAGKRESINMLYEWMDPRYISTLSYSKPEGAERERPQMWRYWQALPAKGHIGIFAGSWYSDPIRLRIKGKFSDRKLQARINEVNRFEEMLVKEGVRVLKLWFHLSKKDQVQRFKTLESDPRTAWRVTSKQWKRLKDYDRLQTVAGELLRATHTPAAPWVVIHNLDDKDRLLAVGHSVLQCLTQPMPGLVPTLPPPKPVVSVQAPPVLGLMNLQLALPDKPYELELAHWQGRLAELARDPCFAKRSLVCVFEGADAAGKGGSIRRITAALDASRFQVIPVAAPTQEERTQPYLWRFWRHLPRHGHVTLFDRSWYGRVLVERIEGFCTDSDWQRAYSEINDFEAEMAQADTVVLKFWLQVSQEEQLKRFREREKTPFKRFKITQEDWRNRDKWESYQKAVEEMVARTSTVCAPWTLVEANDKNYARVKILRTLCERIEPKPKA